MPSSLTCVLQIKIKFLPTKVVICGGSPILFDSKINSGILFFSKLFTGQMR